MLIILTEEPLNDISSACSEQLVNDYGSFATFRISDIDLSNLEKEIHSLSEDLVKEFDNDSKLPDNVDANSKKISPGNEINCKEIYIDANPLVVHKLMMKLKGNNINFFFPMTTYSNGKWSIESVIPYN